MSSKYDALYSYLLNTNQDTVTLSFEKIEAIVGDKLPSSARKHSAWWSNNFTCHTQSKAWVDAGYLTIDSTAAPRTGRITFIKAISDIK